MKALEEKVQGLDKEQLGCKIMSKGHLIVEGEILRAFVTGIGL